MFDYSLSDDLNDYGTEIRWLSTLYQPSLTCFISLVVVFCLYIAVAVVVPPFFSFLLLKFYFNIEMLRFWLLFYSVNKQIRNK